MLAEAFGRAANEHEPTQDNPWSLIMEFGEHVPGDKLKPYATRKSMVLGFCFQELSDEILCSDYAWMIPVAVSTSIMKSTKGGWSAMLRQYLRVHLLGVHGLATVGVVLNINGAPLHLHA